MDLLSHAVDLALRIARRAEDAGAAVAISIFDGEGRMVLQHRMDGAPVQAAALSERKAYTAALLARRTEELGAAAEPDGSDGTPTAVGGGRYCVLAGGVPLVAAPDVQGGVGVAGGTPQEDAALIDAALQTPGDRPRSSSGSYP